MERSATFSSCQTSTQLVLHVNVPRFSGMRRSAAASMAKASLAPMFKKQTAPRAATRNALGGFYWLYYTRNVSAVNCILLQLTHSEV
jgi:hypothetical protein